MVVEGVNLELDNLYYQVKDDNISEGTKEIEVKPSDNSLCTENIGSCPTWLVENLVYWNGSNNKYSMNNGNEITNIYGYWLLSSNPGNSNIARIVDYNGHVNRDSCTSNANNYGLRAVITISMSDIS